MKMIGGNTFGVLQRKTVAKNDIGETIENWTGAITILGWLDLSSGDSHTSVYDRKVQESTHIFLCDYLDLSDYDPENCRMVIDNRNYEVKLIDDPMGLHQHIEMYLKYMG